MTGTLKFYTFLGCAIVFSAGSIIGGTKTTGRLDQTLRTAAPGEQIVAWVFFTDKGRHELQKTSIPFDVVTPAALERRMRSLPAGAIVDYSDLPLDQAYVDQVASRVGRIRQYSKWFNGVSVVATAEQLRSLEELPFVSQLELVLRFASAGPLPVSPASTRPPSFSKSGQTEAPGYGPSLPQVSLENIPAVHATGNSAQGIVIGVFDNGFRLLNHHAFDSLRPRILHTYDFVDHKVSVAPRDPRSNYGAHGVNTLSTLAGYVPDTLVGPAYGASFILGRTENDSSETPIEEDNWARAIEWAESLGVQVTSTSLGYDTYDLPYKSWTWQDMNGRTTVISRAAVMAARKGVIVLNSAGNEGVNRGSQPNSLIAPADADSILAVGAVTPAGVRAGFSSFGPTSDGRIKPDIMAVGTSIYAASAVNTLGYDFPVQGTSFACPIAAGVAALVLKANPQATAMQVVKALKVTARRASSPDSFYGWGIVDAVAAIKYLAGGDSTYGEPSTTFVLQQNFPNPFNPTTRIAFFLPEPSNVKLSVYDILGREVRTLTEGAVPFSGWVPVTWDGTSADGTRAASGVYVYRLEARGASGTASTQTKKMMLVK